MKTQLGVGLIGFGMAGEFFHAPFIHTLHGFVLHRILERTKERSKEKYPEATVVRSLEELLDSPEIELVVVASPNATHFEYAKKALLAQKHVVVDKPFTLTAKEGEELIALAERQGKILTVYQNRRWDGDFLTIKKLLAEGVLGDILEYEAHFDRFRPAIRPDSWKEADGILLDLGPHLLDQAWVLFGKPDSVSSKIEKQRPGAPAEDFFRIVFHYPGFDAILSAGMLIEHPGPHFVIKGTKGTYTKYGMDPQENFLKQGKIPQGDDWGLDMEENFGILETKDGKRSIVTERGNYAAFYENVREAILKGAKLAVDPRDSLEVIRVIEGARQSA